jgi:hypothetical protein
MRAVLALLLVTAACSDKPPAAPDPKAFAAMGEEAKCEATLPRAKKCVDELMAQQFEDLVDPSASAADKQVSAQVAKEIRAESSFSDEADKLHHVNCAASATYPDAVVACWAETDCKTFSACVIKREHGSRTPKPTSPSPTMTLP